MDNFRKTTNGFNYIYEKQLADNEIVILKMPTVSANKRGINDIGWQSDGDITLYGTLSSFPERNNVLWSKINDNDEVNKTVSALKIVNNSTTCKIVIRVIMN